MNKSKSAQGLSLNVIVIGAIVLVVLLVIVFSFSSFFGNRFTPGFAEATEADCKEGNGYKQLYECGVDTQNPEEGYNYEQVYARFKEGALKENKVCCKSSCKAQGGYCNEAKDCDSKDRLPAGNGGCVAGRVCCSS